MTRRFDLSRDGAFVPANRPKPGQLCYDSSGRRVSETADRRLLFADELPEEPGVEDILILYIAQAWTGMRSTARRAAPLALAGGAWVTAAAGQVSAATLCQAATLCALTAVGGSTLHYWHVSHLAKTVPQTTSFAVRTEPARPDAVTRLADATPPAAPVQEVVDHVAAPPPVEQASAAPAPAAPVAATAQALTPQEPLPLSPVPREAVASDETETTPPPVTGATVQRAMMAKAAAPEEAPVADDVSASAPRSAALLHVRVTKPAWRSAPVVHAAPAVVRMAPPVVARFIPPRRPAPRVVMTRFDMPRWLTETHAPRVVTIMSATPHELAAPHALAAPHDNAVPAADTDHDSDALNVPANEPARPALAVVQHRERFVTPYGQPAYYPRPAYYPPAAYYQPYGYPYGPYGYPYGRY